MATSDWLQSISTVAYMAGFIVLFCLGNAKHLSKRMIHLMFVSFFMDIPPFGALDFFDVDNFVWWTILYAVGGAFFLWIMYEFYKPNCLFQRTYNPNLDNMWFAQIYLFLLAAAVPVMMIFLLPSGLEGCTPDAFKIKELRGGCIYSAVWTTSLCLFPLAFLPQLWIVYKLRKQEEPRRPTRNVRFFLFCMMILCVTDICIYVFGFLYLWKVAVFTYSIAFFFIGFPWLTRMICHRGLKDPEEGEEDDIDNQKGGGAGTTAVGGTSDGLDSANDIELSQQQLETQANAQAWTSGHDQPPVDYNQPMSQTTPYNPDEHHPAQPTSSEKRSSWKTWGSKKNVSGGQDPAQAPPPASNTTADWGTGWLS